MRTRALATVLLVLCLAACNGLAQIDYLKTVTSGRDGWQHPQRVIAALNLSRGDVVADIGAGDGYFLPWLSTAVGPTGKVYAVEVTDQLVATLRARVASDALANVTVIYGALDDPQLPDGEIDLVFTCKTYHHISDRPVYFARVRTALSPRGRVAHLDERDDVRGLLRLFATTGHWSNVAEMRHEMEQAGYQQVEGFDFLPTQSFELFVPITAFQEEST